MSRMLEAIGELRVVVVEFHNYLSLTKEHTKSWQRYPIQTMIENSVSTIRKLDKLSQFVKENQNDPAVENKLAEKFYAKLIEYIARVQECIKACQFREKNNLNLEYSEFLDGLNKRLDLILLKPENFYIVLPKKHWLTVEQMACNVANERQVYSNLSKNSAVIFRELRWKKYDVTKTTQEIELTKGKQIDQQTELGNARVFAKL